MRNMRSLIITAGIGTFLGLAVLIALYLRGIVDLSIKSILVSIAIAILVSLSALSGFYGKRIPPTILLVSLSSAGLIGILLGLLISNIEAGLILGVVFAIISFIISLPRRFQNP